MLAILAAGLGMSACQAPQATFERTFMADPAKPYLGMTQEQVIACAGKPHNRLGLGTGETLTYRYSGAGPVPSAEKAKSDEAKGPLGKPKSDKNWACSASLVFESGKLARVTVAPREVVGPYDTKKDPKTGEKVPVPQPERCAFSLPNCAR
jgi:hypothetical protein